MIDIKELRRLVESPVLQQVGWVSREWALEHFGSSCEAEFVSTFNPSAILSLLDKIDAQQAEIDALMLEYCPDEMTKEQLLEWARHQRVSEYQPPKIIKQENPWFSIDADGQPKTAGFYDILYRGEKYDAVPDTYYYDGEVWYKNSSSKIIGDWEHSMFGNSNTKGERYRKSDKSEIIISCIG